MNKVSKLLALISAFALAALLAGCGDGKSASTPEAGTSQDAVVLDELEWPEDGLGAGLPIPESEYGNVLENGDERFEAVVQDTSPEAYTSYVAACNSMGFSCKALEAESSYSAENESGYQLALTFDSSDSSMRVTVDEPVFAVTVEMRCVSNLFFSRYDISVSLGGKHLGDIAHGESTSFTEHLPKGSYTLEVSEKGSESVCGTMEIEVVSDACHKLKAYCHSDSIDIETDTEEVADSDWRGEEQPEKRKVGKDELAVASASSDYYGTPYKKVVKSLKKAGFTNVKAKALYDLESPDAFLSPDKGDVESVRIGKVESFSKGDIFKRDAKVVVAYHMCKYENPKIKFKAVSADKLLSDLDSNAYKASDTYDDKYLEVTGVVVSVSSSGRDFNIGGDKWDIINITCVPKTDKLREKMLGLKTGKSVTVRGRITGVSDFGYMMDLYKFV